MSHNRDLSAAAAQIGVNNSNIGIATDNPNTKLQIVTTSGARALTLTAPTLGPYMVFETNSTAFADIGSEAGLTGSGSNVDMLTLNARGSRSLSFRTNSTERIRITSAGKVGIDNANPNAKLEVKGIGGSTGLTFRGTDSSGNTNFWVQDGGRVGVHYYPFSINQDYSDSATPSGTYFYIHGNSPFIVKSDGKVGVNQTAPAHQLDVKISDNTTYTPGNFILNGAARLHNESTTTNSFASLVFRTASGDNAIGFVYPGTVNQADFVICNDGGANGVERLRITSGGDVGIGDNAPNSNYGTNLSVHSTATDGARLKLSDGTSGKGNTDGFDLISTGGVAYILNRENADMSFSTNNSERLRIYANGKIHLGNSHIDSNNLTRLHVGWNTGGTVAGESIIAGTLGNGTTAVSALLTMKNAGNRGTQGHVSGSSLAKFEFNNGTAFEIDKYGRRTLQYQPGCKISIDSNSQGGGNQTQTGRTILPFNSTAYGYNTGNHYNLTTHTFTCPLNGKYLVILSVNIIGDNIAYIYKNGSIHSAGEFRSNPTNVWEHMEVSTVVDCSANDTIQPYSQLIGSGKKFNGGSGGSYWDTFTIYFLG
jgi:hypothetical protein